MKHIATLAFAGLLALSAQAPAFAQSRGDDSLVSVCRNRLEQIQVDYDGTRDPAKKAAAGNELNLAKLALGAGNPAECTIHLDKAENAMK